MFLFLSAQFTFIYNQIYLKVDVKAMLTTKRD